MRSVSTHVVIKAFCERLVNVLLQESPEVVICWQ
jgi:hypothetical protein